jgi:integrase
MPDLESVLAEHAEWLRQRGCSKRTIYDRRRAVTRLAAWLDAGGPPGIQSHPEARGSRGGPGPADDHAAGASSVLNATPADLAAWRAGLTVGDRAVVGYCGHVREFYAHALARGLIAVNPAVGLPLPSLPRGIPRPVSEEDLGRALAAADARVRPWLVLAGWAGLRAKEIALLRRDRVLDTAAPPVLLIARDATKGRHERIVPASGFVLAELRLAGLPASGWVFPRHDGKRGPNAPWLVSQRANLALRDTGSAATLHQLRHRFLTMVYRETHDLRLTQDLAGHASPSTTAGYAAFDRSEAAAAVESLPAPGRLRILPGEKAV